MRAAAALQQQGASVTSPEVEKPEAYFTAEQVAAAVGSPLGNVQTIWPLVVAALDEFGQNDRAAQIAAAATIRVEAPPFWPIEEYRNADGSYPSYWYGYSGGPDFHGRGLIQITHDYNYRHYGERLGIDLIGNLALALDATVSARILACYFQEHGIGELADAGRWKAVRIAVNGGTNGLDHFLQLVDTLSARPGAS